jgi:hypothetical protein
MSIEGFGSFLNDLPESKVKIKMSEVEEEKCTKDWYTCNYRYEHNHEEPKEYREERLNEQSTYDYLESYGRGDA